MDGSSWFRLKYHSLWYEMDWNYGQTFMAAREWIRLTFAIPWFFMQRHHEVLVIVWIASMFDKVILGAQRMILNDFDRPLTFHLLFPCSWNKKSAKSHYDQHLLYHIVSLYICIIVHQCKCNLKTIWVWDYILETPIEDLQLLFGEVSLRFQLVKALRSVTHRRHLQLLICFIYRQERGERERDKEKAGDIYYIYILSRRLQSPLNMCSSQSLWMWKLQETRKEKTQQSSKLLRRRETCVENPIRQQKLREAGWWISKW